MGIGHLARLAILTVVILSSGCSSSERMLRISPLTGESSPDRVNLWPLLYSDKGSASVLWPLFDLDENGFALRPLVAKDGSDWGVLYPFCSFDTETGNGWAFPFYKTENYTGLFPLANIGKLSYVGPVWWRPEKGTGGLFPIAYFGGGLNYVGPAWWTSEKGSYFDGGLFPIAMFGRFNHFLLAWWTEAYRSFGLFPLFGWGRLKHIGPIWWDRDGEGRTRGGLFPLFHRDASRGEFSLLPLYSHDLGPESATRNYLLGLGHSHRSPGRSERWLFPFYYQEADGAESDTTLIPFYWRRERGDRTQVFTLLGNSDSEGEKSSLNIYPLWWSWRSEASSREMLLPFYSYTRSGDERSLVTLLGGYGWSVDGQSRYLNVLGPLYHHSRSADGKRERTALLWPLYEKAREGEETTLRLLPFYGHRSAPDRAESWYALGLGHHERVGDASAHRLWPLYSHAATPEPGILYDLSLFQSRVIGDTRRRRLFPLYWSSRSATRRDVSVLLGLGNYRRRGSQKSWMLWPLASRSEGSSDPNVGYDLTLVGSARWQGGESFHLVGPLLYHGRRTESETERERTRRFLLALYTIDEAENLAPHVPYSERPVPANRVEHKRHSALFGAFVNERATYHLWRDDGIEWSEMESLRAAVAEAGDGEGPGAGTSERLESARRFLSERGFAPSIGRSGLRRAALDFTDSEAVLLEHRHVRIPLLYEYDRKGDVVERSGPLWLVQSRKEPGKSKFSFLYYAYRSETRGDRTTRDIFPFITADTSPERSKFTFLWRLIHYERNGDRRGGHILFIPWGRL